jgi:beta-lactamase class C
MFSLADFRVLMTAFVLVLPGAVRAAPVAGSASAEPMKTAVDIAVMRFMAEHSVPGAAVGIVTPEGCRVFNYGYANLADKTPVTDATLFEIGSVSKTFAATLASYAAVTGRLSLDEPVAGRIPSLAGSPFGRVTLLELGTHTSGLGLMPPKGVADEAQLESHLAHWKLPYRPGTKRTYSNVGIGILGSVAARSLGRDYPSAVTETILAPLGMKHTFYDVPASESAHYALGTDKAGNAVRLSRGVLWAEAYGVKSTASDMLIFLKANLGQTGVGSLAKAVRATHTGYFRTGEFTQCLIWDELPYPVDDRAIAVAYASTNAIATTPVQRLDPPLPPESGVLYGKTGMMKGFSSYVAFVPGEGVGIVMLFNRPTPGDERVRLALKILEAAQAARPASPAQ